MKSKKALLSFIVVLILVFCMAGSAFAVDTSITGQYADTQLSENQAQIQPNLLGGSGYLSMNGSNTILYWDVFGFSFARLVINGYIMDVSLHGNVGIVSHGSASLFGSDNGYMYVSLAYTSF